MAWQWPVAAVISTQVTVTFISPRNAADVIFTRMRSNPRYKLGRISFFLSFFFFVMVVANCNASCYWLHVHCSQWQFLLFFPSGIKIAFVAIRRVSCGELVYCLTRCTNPELVAKGEHILCMTSC